MKERLRIIVGGFIGLYPTGGVTWDYIQYPLGLKTLGHDVYYIEDTLQYSRYQSGDTSWEDASYSINYLKKTMEEFGFAGKWAYRDVASGGSYGMTESEILELCNTADLFINISASTFLRDEYLKIPVRVLIDSDPMFTQIEYYNEKYLNSNTDRYKMKFVVENHTHHFTFGENIGNDDCKIPALGFRWIPTRQPVCLQYWSAKQPMQSIPLFTTIMNWSVKQDIEYADTTWGQKNNEFEKFKRIPHLYHSSRFELMLTGAKDDKIEELKENGWEVTDALQNVTDAASYRNFIHGSTAEFSVAKETYVKSNSGWFSCRSACYLASGRPVITQETGWSGFIPTGLGLFSFVDEQSAIAGLEAVAGNIKKHSSAAREIAEEFFDSDKILGRLIAQVNSNH